MVQVHRHGAPAPATVLDPGRRRRLGEAVAAAVDVEHVAGAGDGLAQLAVDRGHVPVEAAVAVEVGHRAAHAVGVQAGSRRRGHLGEGAVTVVAVVLAGAQVGGDQQLRVAVAVHVGEQRGEAQRAQAEHPGLTGDLGEGAVAVVAEQRIGVVDQQLVAPLRAPRSHRQVQVAVQVVVAERRAHAGRPLAGQRGDAGLRRHLGEGAVAVVAVEPQASRRGGGQLGRPVADHVEIDPAVAVVIAGDRPEAAVAYGEPRLLGAVAEGAVTVVEVEPVRPGAAAGDEEQVLPAVAVEVRHRAAGGHPRKRIGEGDEHRRAQPGTDPLLGEMRLGGRAGAEAAAEQRRTGCGAQRAPRAQTPSTRPSCCASSRSSRCSHGGALR